MISFNWIDYIDVRRVKELSLGERGDSYVEFKNPSSYEVLARRPRGNSLEYTNVISILLFI